MKAKKKHIHKPQESSLAQQEYLRANKSYRISVFVCRIAIWVGFLCLWEISAQKKWIDPFFFSSPLRIVQSFRTLCRDSAIFFHIGITLLETVSSFFLVSLISLITATLLWYLKRLSEVLEPYLVILNSLPKSALAPLMIVWFGTGMRTIMIAGISVAIFGSIISFYTAFSQNNDEKLTLIYTLGGSKWDAFSKVIFPGSFPILLSTTKVNIGLCLVGVIIGEFLAGRRGLGYLIIYGSQVFQLNLVITSILILCLISVVLYLVLQWVEHQFTK